MNAGRQEKLTYFKCSFNRPLVRGNVEGHKCHASLSNDIELIIHFREKNIYGLV